MIEKAFISDRAGLTVVDFLADELPLSKSKIKDAMQKGAVWLRRGDEEPMRLRRAKEFIKLDDEVHLYYDPVFLAAETPKLELIADCESYSVWRKPEGILQEQSLFGDHLNIEKVVDISVCKDKDCHWIYPSQIPSYGLFLIAHTRNMAARFEASELEEGIDTVYSILRPKSETAISEHDEFLVEHEAAGLRKETYNRRQYFFKHGQGKELDIIEAFETRIEQRLLEEFPVELICEKIRFACPIDNSEKAFSLNLL